MWFCFLENIAAIWGLITAYLHNTIILLSPKSSYPILLLFYITISDCTYVSKNKNYDVDRSWWTKRDGSNWIHPSQMEQPCSSHPRLPLPTVSVLSLLDWARTYSLSIRHMKVVRPNTIKTKYSTDLIRARLEQRSEACQRAGCVSHD